MEIKGVASVGYFKRGYLCAPSASGLLEDDGCSEISTYNRGPLPET